ncbi:ABC transporter permease subunit [Streptomyces sp. NBC_01387]|uniref:ABC transporter permease n=1 Tax=unclassified Streptomyces TaxID=2593676 RepID=UPI002023DC5E|nr:MULTISPECIES: ABC transporter permease subunit [unclassified Streptomyces]MCX4553741.1 ABC transporter permease subunit [Streptomyces sp. NBC_01500]WSC18664.1 ABC transporter permease subunit [Streptomyces sp. NBC_01766]WSV52698.1 ABC transporter permease subunit [Streptomyces sp. NBC_01014]
MAETAPPLPLNKRRRKSKASSPPAVAQRRLSLWQRIKRDKVMLLLTLPGFLYFVVFHYIPLLGYMVAFQDYQPYLGYMHSAWTGFANFTNAFADPAFWSATGNTVEIAFVQLIFFFPVPIALALLLNSIVSDKLRRFIQSVVYLPHFIGWVIIVSIFQQVLGGAGLLPGLLADMGLPRYDMMSDPNAFPWLIALQSIWKDAGWGTIIILAALLGIDKQQYEAAAIDGAGRWRRLWHVTLPGIAPVIILLLILNLGQILSVGFEQILLQRDAVGPGSGEVLDTYVYYHGIKDNQWGISAAVGLVKAVVGTVLVLGANKFAHRLGHEGVYRGADS